MLVLSLKQLESVVIYTPEPIRVTFIRNRGNSYQLGFEAPQSMRIVRQEYLGRQEETNRNAK